MHGVSCHGSAPERGDNAIHKMAEVILNVRDLNENDAADDKEVKGLVKMLDPKYNPEHWEDARFLGRGTCTTSQIFYTCLLYTSQSFLMPRISASFGSS